MTKENYNGMLRIIGFVSAALLWCLSLYFSSKGFGFEMGSDLSWIGFILALVVTAIQIIWNHEAKRMNMTIWVVGICSYVYGIYANVSGIAGVRGGINLPEDFISLIFPLLLGVCVEIVPEPLLVWSITGDWSTGDFFGNFINGNIPSSLPSKAKSPTKQPPQKKAPAQTQRKPELTQKQLEHIMKRVK